MRQIRVGGPYVRSYQVEKRKPNGKRETRYGVEYRIYTDGGRPVRKHPRGFLRRGEADTFAQNVRRAALEADGWRFDGQWLPVHGGDFTTSQPETVIELLEAYWLAQSPAKAPSRRSNIRGRLIVMAATLLDNPQVAGRVVKALKSQASNLRTLRPYPKTPEEWAARWLVDHFLPPARTILSDMGEATSSDLTPELSTAEQWLRSRSRIAQDLGVTDLVLLRDNLTGAQPTTTRTYWSIVTSVLRWAVVIGRLDRDPSIGVPKVRRDLFAEEVDPLRVPDASEIRLIASAGEERFPGQGFQALVLLAGFGAMRISEVLDLKVKDVVVDEKTGGLWVTVRTQSPRQTKRHSDDGNSTRSTRPPKGRTSGPRARRKFYIASDVGTVILKYTQSVSSQPDDHLFRSARAGRVDADTFRRLRWNVVIEKLFPEGHRLAGLHFHDLRHAGMTLWLRSGIPFPKIQEYGGWSSLKVMLDTYGSVLPGDEATAVRLLEAAIGV